MGKIDPNIDEVACTRTERGWTCNLLADGNHIKNGNNTNSIIKAITDLIGTRSPILKYGLAFLIYTGITGLFEIFAIFMDYWGYTFPFGFILAVISTLGFYIVILAGVYVIDVAFGRISAFIALAILSVVYMMCAIYVDYYFGIYIIPAITHHDPPLWFALFAYVVRLVLAGLPLFPWAEDHGSDLILFKNN